MNIALVHELLTMRGGAEHVLKIIAEMFPDAPIYTLLYDKKKMGDWFPRERIHEAILPTHYSLLPTSLRFNHHLYLPFFPHAVEAWDFSEFDLVISSSSAFVHGTITNSAPRHLCYVHTPARYLWDRTHEVLARAGQGPFGAPKRACLERIFHRLRIWDAEAASRPDKLLAASKDVQRRIELYWRRESTVLHPPIDDFWLKERAPIREQMEHGDYFLVVSTLVPYKRIELAIEACNRLGAHLNIVGEGPDRSRLERMAGSTVKFYGYRERDELADLFASARATIFPGEEDFGLVPLESMASGTPVVAYGKGGATETVVEGETGMFFHEPTAAALTDILTHVQKMTFSREACRRQSGLFTRERFASGLKTAIANVMEQAV